jgi:hypothetical protein
LVVAAALVRDVHVLPQAYGTVGRRVLDGKLADRVVERAVRHRFRILVGERDPHERLPLVSKEDADLGLAHTERVTGLRRR